jgi:hypothetical protein
MLQNFSVNFNKNTHQGLIISVMYVNYSKDELPDCTAKLTKEYLKEKGILNLWRCDQRNSWLKKIRA